MAGCCFVQETEGVGIDHEVLDGFIILPGFSWVLSWISRGFRKPIGLSCRRKFCAKSSSQVEASRRKR